MNQTATVNISFSKQLLKDIDQVASDEARTRSELLREATRMYIERKRRLKDLFGFWRGEAKRRGFKAAHIAQAVRRARAS
jgi:metal-responsive CopG/Arc/MetJ family transcriptional regulator